MSTTLYTSTNSRPCAHCGQRSGRCVQGCWDSDIDGLSWTGVMDAFVEVPQNHAKGRVRVPRVPVGAIVLVMLGLTLMAFGLVLNEPVSLFIYGLIHN